MSNPFRDEYLQNRDQGFFGELARSSLLAAESKFYGVNAPRLTVSIDGGAVSAYESAKLTMAVVDATALFSRYVLHPGEDAVNVLADHRKQLSLRPLGSAGNHLEFGFPDVERDAEFAPLFGDRSVSLAEKAALDMAEVLPGGTDDDGALDSVLSLPVAQRKGIETLAKAVKDIDHGLAMTVSVASGQSSTAMLSRPQAVVLKDALSETKVQKRLVTDRGVLDGVRTRRRLFYLERDTGDIHGSVADDVLPELGRHLGKPVQVTLEEITPIRASGSRGKTTYRLTSITPDAGLFD
ncbi:hypothetical protein [Dietzia sp. PP-33]|uniref:hypothetical protein n=1 Tax=Dietzia sp. PP-33 TaxID=2957500 RepID=UPI0029A1BA2B|nr:hypothetical protein [Dietzia sp. PP-33]MDX2357442.1 hypothetical protein [Dietzia sp. PP-33]